jgi:hypothetical protein
MPGPEKNFGTLSGITPMLQSHIPQIMPTIRINAFVWLWRKTHTFFRFGLTKQAIVTIGVKPSVRITRPFQNVSVSRLMLVTFPPIYKTRTGRARPLKGQLWPRTR